MRIGPRNALLHPSWRLPSLAYARFWALAVAALALLGLLLAFHEVVRGAVLQGEQRRAAVAAIELATWRCSTQPRATLRSSCLAALGAKPQVDLVALDGR